MKFDDYFFYAFDQYDMTEGENNVTSDCSTTQECGNTGLLASCCVNVVMAMEEFSYYGEGEKTYHNMYRCMNTAVVSANWEMTLGDMVVQMECLENNDVSDMMSDLMKGFSSGATKMAATVSGVMVSTMAAWSLV